MNSAEPSLCEVTCVLSPQLLGLASALAPVAMTARRALSRKVAPSGHEFVVLDDLTYHMRVIGHGLSQIASRLDGLMSEVIRNDSAGLLEVGRSTGRMEQVLCELVNGYLEAKASHAAPEHAKARALIVGVYRHHIRNICDWMDDLILAINNPLLELDRRGIMPADQVELSVPLEITRPPQMTKLEALVKSLQPQEVNSEAFSKFPQQVQVRAPGVLGTLWALVFGLGLSGTVFGKEHA